MKRLSCSVILLVVGGSASAQTPNNARMLSTPNEQTGTSYTFVAADTTRVTTFNNASPVAATLPNGATVGFGPGNMLSVVNKGAGAVTITCTSCTINANGVAAATLVLSQGQGADIYGGIGNPAVNYVALPSPSGTFSNITASSLTVSGTGTFTGTSNTFANLNNVIWVCNTVYACTDAGLQAAHNALSGGGTIVIPPGTGVAVANTVNISNPNITVMGAGPGSSIQVGAFAGDVFNVTGSRFHLQDMEFGMPTTTRTGAIIHASSSGAVIGYVSNLDVVGNASSTNNGHFFLADASTGNIVQWNFRDIRIPRGTTWTSHFKFSNPSGSNTDSTFRILGYVGGASFTDSGIVVDGAIDTLQISQSQWNNDSGTGKGIHIRNTVGGFIDPRFVNVEQSAIEAIDGGTHVSTAVQIDNGRLNEFINVQCANTTTCYTLGTSSGSVLDTLISNGKGITLQQNYVNIGANAIRTKIIGNRISQASQQTDGGYSMVLAAANATDFDVIDNTYTCPNAGNRIHYGVEVTAGTGDRIKIIANNFSLVASPFNCLFAAGTSIGASGVDIQNYGNAPINNTTPRMVIGSNPAQTSSALDMASAFPLCWRNNANSADICGSKDTSDNWTWASLSKSKTFVADQGSVCTNGELALSAGWQSTGSATVTGVAGNGQTCSWTITTGTTTAANPTVTDTLTNALPAATTRCWMFLEYGPASTHTAAAGEGFAQTTLSATAPVFTFNGTPTAAGKTYLVVRTCGP